MSQSSEISLKIAGRTDVCSFKVGLVEAFNSSSSDSELKLKLTLIQQ